MRTVDSDPNLIIVASGRCPFCRQDVHLICPKDKLSESVKIFESGRLDINTKDVEIAHPEPWCIRFKDALGRKGNARWILKAANMRLNTAPN
jgi:hypothetical protein